MKNKLNILIIEDHPIIVDSIKNNLDQNLFNVFSCSDIIGAKSLLNARQFYIVISDIRLKNGTNAFDLFNKLNKLHESKLIIYSSYANPWLFVKLSRNGISPNCVIEKTDFPDWNKLINKVLSGNTCFSASAVAAKQTVETSSVLIEIVNLTPRKWEILMQLIHGKTDKEIAESCYISRFTANDHRKSIYKLLNIKDAPSLILKFREFGFHDIESL